MSRKALIATAALLCAALAIGGAAMLLGRKRLWIATILPLTGPNAAAGRGMRNAIRLAIDETNRRGGVQGHPIALAEFDDASDDKRAVEAGSKLVADQRILGAIVHYDHDCSTVTKEMLGVAHVPNILGGIATRELPETVSDFEFRMLPTANAQMKSALDYAWDVVGARKFLYAHDRSTVGREAIYQFRAAFDLKFEKLVLGGDFGVVAGNPDFGPTVAKAVADKPDYILYGGEPRDGAKLLVELRAAGVTAAFQMQSHELSQEFIDAAKDKAEGAVQIFTALPLDATPEGKAFLADYEKAFHEPPVAYGIFAYAEAQSLLQAMEKSFLTRPSIRGALANEEFDTALGPIRFNYFGSTWQRAVVYQVIHGRWTPIEMTDVKGKLQPLAH